MFQNPGLRIVGIVCLFLLTTSPGVSQSSSHKPSSKGKNVSQDQPADIKPRKSRTERADAFKRWIDEDVVDIVTTAERQAFEKLKTDEEREQFVHIFWQLRDPSPDTEENEYREEHYERVAYANEHFTSGKAGRLTDRGRIYIKFGKPDQIEAHPGGGQYQRMSYEGSGSTSTYPFERWFYRYLRGVGSGIEIEFVDRTGSGEYRIARDFNEKDALANVPGNTALPEGTYFREQDSPFAKADLLFRLDKAPEIDRRFIGSDTGSPKVDDNPLNFDIRADYFKLSDDRVITAFTIQADNRDLVFKDSGGLQIARLNIVGRIVNLTERRVGAFEDSVTSTATAVELSEAKERKSAYSKVVVLPPGHYKVDVIVRDTVSGAEGVQHFGFQVPKYDDNKLSTSSMILAAKLENMEGRDASGQFVIGKTKVIPNLTGVYRQGQPVGVYLQLYNAGIDQTTLRPSVDVEYVLLKNGKEVAKQLEDWLGLSESGPRLTLSRLIDTRQLSAGEYELTIRIRDRVSGQALTPSAKFTVQ